MRIRMSMQFSKKNGKCLISKDQCDILKVFQAIHITSYNLNSVYLYARYSVILHYYTLDIAYFNYRNRSKFDKIQENFKINQKSSQNSQKFE